MTQPIKAITGDVAYKTRLTNGTHELIADEPVLKGGTDKGPTPHEFLLMSLAACISITLKMYSARKNWDVGEITVAVSMHKDESGTQFTSDISFEKEINDEMRERLLLIADKCPVHKTLSEPIQFFTKVV